MLCAIILSSLDGLAISSERKIKQSLQISKTGLEQPALELEPNFYCSDTF